MRRLSAAPLPGTLPDRNAFVVVLPTLLTHGSDIGMPLKIDYEVIADEDVTLWRFMPDDEERARQQWSALSPQRWKR